MNKKIISLLMGATMLASAMPVMATTEGIVQDDILLISANEVAENTFTGTVTAIEDGRVIVKIDEVDYAFILDEGVELGDIKVGDSVKVTSPSTLMTKDIKTATSIVAAEAEKNEVAENTFTGTVTAIEDGRVIVKIDEVDYAFILDEGVELGDIKVGDSVKVTSPSTLMTKDIKTATSIVATDATANDETEVDFSYKKYAGVVAGADEKMVNVTVEGDMVVSFFANDNTPIYTIKGEKADAVKTGDNVIVVSSSSSKTKDIKDAEAIIVTDKENEATSVYVDTFKLDGEQLVSADGELVLNMENAKDYDGKKLLVFYDFATASIPAQTNPIKVVELKADEAEDEVTISFNIGNNVIAINGKKVEVEKPYVVGEGVTLVPIRVISEAFGAEVKWDDTTKSVTVVDGDKTIIVTVNSKKATVNGEEKELEEAPELTENGFTMIPLRFISENLGSEVGYVADTQAITVTR